MPPKRKVPNTEASRLSARRKRNATSSIRDPNRFTRSHPETSQTIPQSSSGRGIDNEHQHTSTTAAPTTAASHLDVVATQLQSVVDRLHKQSDTAAGQVNHATERLNTATDQLNDASERLEAAGAMLEVAAHQLDALSDQPSTEAQPMAQGPNFVPPPQGWQHLPGGILAQMLSPDRGAIFRSFVGNFKREDFYWLKALNRVCENTPWPEWNPFRDPLSVGFPGPGRYLQVQCGNYRRPLPIYTDVPANELNPPAVLRQEWGVSEGPAIQCSHNQYDSQNSGSMEFFRCAHVGHWHFWNGGRNSHRHPGDWLCAPCAQYNRRYMETRLQSYAAMRIWPLCRDCSNSLHADELRKALQRWNATHPATEQKHMTMSEADLVPVRRLYWCKCRYNLPIGTAPLCLGCVDKEWHNHRKTIVWEMRAMIPYRVTNGHRENPSTYIE